MCKITLPKVCVCVCVCVCVSTVLFCPQIPLWIADFQGSHNLTTYPLCFMKREGCGSELLSTVLYPGERSSAAEGQS